MQSSAVRLASRLFVLSLLALPSVAHPQTTAAALHKRAARHAARSGWRELACVADAGALPADAYHFVDGGLTHETCMSTCAALGFPVAGARNGDECWCAAAAPDTTHAVLDDAECDRPCAGNGQETCGGTAQSLVFVDGAAEQFLDASEPHALRARTTITLPTGWLTAGACVVDSSTRVLVGASSQPTTNTPLTCVTLCATLGYKLAGVEDGNQCFCGNSYAAYPTPAPATDCNSACQGDSTQTCGGAWRLQIYSNGQVALPAALPTTLPTGWAPAVSCAVDSSTRVLADYMTWPSPNSPAICAALCDGMGYKLAGVESGAECHCANSYSAYPTSAPTTDCNAACPGDSATSDTCGGGWRLQIYSKGTVALPAAPPAPPATLPAGWAPVVACAIDSSTRVLADYVTWPSPNSPAVCASLCDGMGYTLAGVESGAECHCANSYSAYPTSAPTTDCNAACPGDSATGDTCGGGWRLQIYSKGTVALPAAPPATLPAGWAPAVACAVDSSARVLADYESWPSPNSPAVCATLCDGLGYALAGVESGAECHCAHAYAAPPTPAPATDCSSPCQGDGVATDTCGGGWRLQIYSKGAVAPPVTAPAPLPTGWAAAVPCAVDSDTRVLATYTAYPTPNSPAVCAALCDGLGYTLAGVEDGNECHCASTYGAAPTLAPVTDCSSACSGDSASETCGGSWRLQIYSKAATTTTTTSTTTTTTTTSSTSTSSTVSYSGSTVAPVPTSTPAAASRPRYVVAHMIVGNTYTYTQADWLTSINLASAAGIDAFALNLGADYWEMGQVANAYAAATLSGTGFKMFFSFDVTSLSCGSQNDAATLRGYINQYINDPAQFLFNGKPLVSTFSGENCYFGQGSVDAGWLSVVRNGMPPLYFIPSFFSNAATLYQYTSSDGDFDWNGGWPMGDYDVNMDETNQHIAGNGGRFFMAAVTPWFFTHFNYKNWLYRSDDWLYNSRWEELLANRNEVDIVEIVTWNDFGESHYIGPIAPDQDQPNSGWVDGFPHSPWTDMTLYYAQAFKTGQFPAITKDSVYIWSRPHPANAQATNDGLGPPTGASWTADNLWAVVFCTGPGQLTLTSGSNSQAYVVSAGVTKLSIPNAPGTIRATLIRNGVTVVDVAPTSSQFQFITSPPQYNFNAYVAGGHSS